MTRDARIGSRTVAYPSAELGELARFAGDRRDGRALRETLACDGYLFLREAIPAPIAAAAGAVVADALQAAGALAGDEDPRALRAGDASRRPNLDRDRGLTHHPALDAAVAGPELASLLTALLGETALAQDHRFLRAVAPGEATGAHLDAVYFGRGPIASLRTCWLALSDSPIEQGPLTVLAGSHREAAYAPIRERYGSLDADRDRLGDAGWLSREPLQVSSRLGGRWLTADMRAGDAVIFGMHLLHASLMNLSDRYRISCDLRWQPERLLGDPRWTAPGAPGHDRWHEPSEDRPMSAVLADLGLDEVI
jgi:ectoine hydroxylase-related dioxygenase (phytanoyl-CoA dioxygenase family)